MAYYNGKKVLSVCKFGVDVPSYEGSYEATSNGIYPTKGCKMDNDFVVSVSGVETPSYQGDYTITSNGTYQTSGLKMDQDLVVNVPTSVESGTLKALLDATKSCFYLFFNYQGTSVEGLISYSDTSSVKRMGSMFYNCSSLTSIPQLDTSMVTDMFSMFYNCSSLTTIPQLDTSRVTDMYGIFDKCSSLESIPQLDVSNVTRSDSMFGSCRSLKSILMTGMKTSFNISASTRFERSDLLTIINNLASVTSTKTLTMGATNLAKLTDEDIAIATAKGWTLK